MSLARSRRALDSARRLHRTRVLRVSSEPHIEALALIPDAQRSRGVKRCREHLSNGNWKTLRCSTSGEWWHPGNGAISRNQDLAVQPRGRVKRRNAVPASKRNPGAPSRGLRGRERSNGDQPAVDQRSTSGPLPPTQIRFHVRTSACACIRRFSTLHHTARRNSLASQ